MRIKLRKIEQCEQQIDYAKLEEIIASAIKKAEKEQTEQYSITREWMKFILYPVFWGISGLSGIFAVGCFFLSGKSILSACQEPINLSGFINGMVLLFLGLILIALCISSYGSAKEIDKENDRQYVATMFSNMVALVAMVVAFIALFKG